MATAIQWRRGNTSQTASFTGLVGEITVDTDLSTVIVHDGSTSGGHRLAKFSELSAFGDGDITSVVAGTGLSGGTTSGDATINIDNSVVATLTDSQTLTNKTLTSPVLNTGISGSALIDDDSMGTATATTISSSESIKAYVDAVETDDVAEGSTNVYFSTARARASVSGGTGITYTQGTGVIALTDEDFISGVTAGSGITGGGATGNITVALDYENMAGNLIPTANVTYDLGSTTMMWKDIYVGPGSLYVNGQKVLEDDAGTITISADADQNVAVKTSGSGDVELNASGTGVINAQSSMLFDASKTLGGTGGLQLSSNINASSNYINNVGAPAVAGDATNKTYVDGTSYLTGGDGIDNDSSTLNLDATVVRTAGDQTIGGAKTFSSDVIFNGDFTVNGTTSTVNTETIYLEDNIITLNYGTSGAPTENAGLTVDRGSSADVNIQWNETSDQWEITTGGSAYTKIAQSTTDLTEGTNLYYTTGRWDTKLASADTDDLSEGSTNLYHTTARARAAISVSGDLGYNSTTGVISFTNDAGDIESVVAGTGMIGGGTSGDVTLNVAGGFGITANADDIQIANSDVRALFTASGDISYNNSTGVFSFTNDAGDIESVTAGNGLTGGGATGAITIALDDSHVKGLVSAGGDLSYNSSTGAFSFSHPTMYNDADATDAARAAVSAGGDIAYNSSTGVISYTTPTERTDAEVRGLISAGGDLAYNSTTGVISFTNDAGDIESVVAGTLLDGGGTSGAVTLNVDLSELTDMTDAVVGTADEMVLLDSGVQKRKLISEITLSDFSNDLGNYGGYTSNVGDITGVTAGTGLTGGGTSGSVTVSLSHLGLENLTDPNDDRIVFWDDSASALSYLDAGTGISISGATMSVNMGAFDTADLTEGTNQYHTSARVNSLIDTRVTNAFVDALNVDADTLDGISSASFMRSDATDSHSGTFTPSTDNSIDLGSSSLRYNEVYAVTFQGTASSAQFADLAEKYESDAELDAGTVVMFGGEKEITACDSENCHAVAGVISTDPAYMMNAGGEGQYVALTGRVPTKVTGPVAKGDLMVSAGNGMAKSNNEAQAGRIIGKAVESSEGGEAVIEVLVNMM